MVASHRSDKNSEHLRAFRGGENGNGKNDPKLQHSAMRASINRAIGEDERELFAAFDRRYHIVCSRFRKPYRC